MMTENDILTLYGITRRLAFDVNLELAKVSGFTSDLFELADAEVLSKERIRDSVRSGLVPTAQLIAGWTQNQPLQTFMESLDWSQIRQSAEAPNLSAVESVWRAAKRLESALSAVIGSSRVSYDDDVVTLRETLEYRFDLSALSDALTTEEGKIIERMRREKSLGKPRKDTPSNDELDDARIVCRANPRITRDNLAEHMEISPAKAGNILDVMSGEGIHKSWKRRPKAKKR